MTLDADVLGRPATEAPANEGDLGPISPELALVDPLLADRARRRLPVPALERAVGASAQAGVRSLPDESAASVPSPAGQLEPRARRRPRLVLVGCVFVLGAIAGGFVGDRQAHVPRPTLEPRAIAQPAPPGGGGVVAQAPLRPPNLAPAQPPTGRAAASEHPPPAQWAANVIGVTARVGHGAVTLVWHRPASSSHVVVIRTPGARSHGTVVYGGSATSYRDRAAQPCTAYRYTIVNYDRRGHRATGVPTSIVTDGCGQS